MCQSSIHKACDMQQQKAKKGGVITNSLRNNYSQHHLYRRTRRSYAISKGHPAEFFRIHVLVKGRLLCIADICPNHTTGGGVLFGAKVLFSIGVVAHFDQFRLLCCEFTHFSVYFLQAQIMFFFLLTPGPMNIFPIRPDRVSPCPEANVYRTRK